MPSHHFPHRMLSTECSAHSHSTFDHPARSTAHRESTLDPSPPLRRNNDSKAPSQFENRSLYSGSRCSAPSHSAHSIQGNLPDGTHTPSLPFHRRRSELSSTLHVSHQSRSRFDIRPRYRFAQVAP